MVLTENVSRNEIRLVLVAMMVIMEMVAPFKGQAATGAA